MSSGLSRLTTAFRRQEKYRSEEWAVCACHSVTAMTLAVCGRIKAFWTPWWLQMCLLLRNYFTEMIFTNLYVLRNLVILWLCKMFQVHFLYMTSPDHYNSPLRQLWFIFLPIWQMRRRSERWMISSKKKGFFFFCLNLVDSDHPFSPCSTLLERKRKQKKKIIQGKCFIRTIHSTNSGNSK